MNMRRWTDHTTEVFLAVVGEITDDQFGDPTELPGWTRAHIVAHVHCNAEALLRLLHWARTGEKTPMYAGPVQRAAEIEEGAALPPQELRRRVKESADRLAAAVDSMPQSAWDAEVVTAQGRTVPAHELLWMRTREVAVHAIDLHAGVRFADLPDEVNTALVIDAARKHSMTGGAAALAAWLTGRTGEAPALQPWL
ncbi:maleylpyruvate isomerase N-terminal domain-containing protein [Streptomyces sioyaensis]|uniref:maleylpyruvate isomerase N-terminal domain-containing protein n=1 Tax=Streptomyces sioyaensis TaxID=67364 RepID=UPI003D749AC9